MNIYRSFFSFLLLSVKPKTVLSTSVTNNVTQHPPETAPRITYDPLTFRDILPPLTLQEITNYKGELECVLCNNSTLPTKCVQTQPTRKNSVPVIFLPYQDKRKTIRFGDLEFFLVGGPTGKINPMFGLLHHLGLQKYKVPKNMGVFPFVSTKNPNYSWLMGNFRKKIHIISINVQVHKMKTLKLLLG